MEVVVVAAAGVAVTGVALGAVEIETGVGEEDQ